MPSETVESVRERAQELLQSLGIASRNPAGCAEGAWLTGSSVFSSLDPTTEQRIADVGVCAPEDYARLVASAARHAREWREVPAPRRGELVRRIALALRESKHALGSLIALETGKIKAEGDGEVQEMIDIADFAV